MKEISMKQLIKALNKKKHELIRLQAYEQAYFIRLSEESLRNYLLAKKKAKNRPAITTYTIKMSEVE